MSPTIPRESLALCCDEGTPFPDVWEIRLVTELAWIKIYLLCGGGNESFWSCILCCFSMVSSQAQAVPIDRDFVALTRTLTLMIGLVSGSR